MTWTVFSPLPCKTIPPLPIMFPPLLFLKCFQKCMWAIQLPHPLVREVGVQRSIDWDLFLPKLVLHLDAGSQPAFLWGGKGARQEGRAGEIRSSKACSERIRGKLLQARVCVSFPGSWSDAQLMDSLPFLLCAPHSQDSFRALGIPVRRKRWIRGKREWGASGGLAAPKDCVAWDNN